MALGLVNNVDYRQSIESARVHAPGRDPARRGVYQAETFLPLRTISQKRCALVCLNFLFFHIFHLFGKPKVLEKW